jgi:NADH-quinone oxidoreductase subunit N
MFMKEPVIHGVHEYYMMNASLSLKTIIGIAAFATIFAVAAVNPLIEFIATLVYNSGY